uniref:Uncharacterized protein n=1 Tax=Cacopsylla melanoneura TaxID=428564 RepID=A0A8D9BJ99_9HEMI
MTSRSFLISFLQSCLEFANTRLHLGTQQSKMKYPHQPLNKHRFVLQMIGVMRLDPFKQKWKNRCVTIYVIVINSICISALISHFICTTTRYVLEYLYLMDRSSMVVKALGLHSKICNRGRSNPTS